MYVFIFYRKKNTEKNILYSFLSFTKGLKMQLHVSKCIKNKNAASGVATTAL